VIVVNKTIMTIDKYYHTFGFLIRREDYLKYFGFTKENIPPEYKSEETTKDDLDECLYEWITETHGNRLTLEREFVVDGVEYIVRGFTHDTNKEDYVVVGIDMGVIDRWEGTQVDGTNCFPKDRIRTLARNKDWIEMIQGSDKHCTYYDPIEYGVQDPKYKKFFICPVVYITTDDCDCCS